MTTNATLRPEVGSDRVVAVVGAGTMGAGIAQLAAVAGHRTLLLDAAPGAAAAAVEALRARLASLAERGRMDAERARAAGERLEAVEAVEALADAGIVIEAVVEDAAAKRELLAHLEAVVGEAVLLLTNTSSLSVTALAAGLARPERFAGMHFFNPAPVMPLVEVVGGEATAPTVLDAVAELARRWGRTPVRTADAPGFIVNRVARPYYGEAHRLLEEQAADAATIDAVLREAAGFRMGPLELTDLVGQDVNLAVSTSVWQQTYQDPRYTPSLVQRRLVDAGRLGRKTGRGIYDYAEGAPPARASQAPARPAPAFVVDEGGFVVNDGLLARAAAVGVAFRTPSEVAAHVASGDVLRADAVTADAVTADTVTADTVTADTDPADSVTTYRGRHATVETEVDTEFETEFDTGDEAEQDLPGELAADSDDSPPFGGGYVLPSGGRLLETNGETATMLSLVEPHVLVDWVLDPETATRVAVAPCDGCPEEVLDEAVGLLQAAGLTVSVIDDVPGLIVARTVSMLVNEAVDLVGRGTATADDVDTAMKLGTNYPLGPLEWGEQIGAGRIVSVLDALHGSVPTGRYRAAGRLRRRALVDDVLELAGMP
ncbi:MAG: 3-hydroxyacyl-CoA dehydrogenase NAD-binding domain-containing protein [Actinomycetes bacterium]